MGDQNPKVSVIIPVYNGQRYLRRCLNSLLSQTYSNLQIIVIDDGSTDETGKICGEYVQAYGIRYIRQENAGVSAARNRGLEVAVGEFVAFCDCDDYCDRNMIKSLLDAIVATDADISCCKVIRVSASQENAFLRMEDISENASIVSIDQAYHFILDENVYAGYIWNKMFRKVLIDEQQPLRFATDIAVLEDELFVVEYLQRCRNMCVLESKLYYYCANEDSVTAQKMSQKKLTAIEGRERINDIIEHADLHPSVKAAAWNNLMRTYAYMFKDLWKYHCKGKKQWIKVIKKGWLQNRGRYQNDDKWTWKARIYGLLLILS